ncbi:MAG: beta strand repeat-containing protein, partial [Hyphomicrobiaceae bacterium]
NDLLKGDGNNLVGTDTFVFAPGDGADIIQDFQPGVDKLDFSAFGNVAINVAQQGGDTLLRVGDVSVTLQGVNANDLSDVDFAQANIAAGDDVVVEDEVEEVVLENNDNGGDNNAGNAAGLSLVGGRAVDDVERRVVSGTDGNDVLNQSNFVDPVDIDGGAGDDQITGTSVAGVSDVLRGGDGNDTFFGLAGDDFLIPGAGDDLRVVGGAGSDTFFPETNGGNDIFPEFSLQDRLDGTLLDGVTAINVSRLDNGRTFLEFEGANTTVQISGGVSPEQFIANANQLLVNFPDGVQVQLAGADVANVVNDNDVVEEVDGAPVREQIVVENNDGDNAGVGVNAADFGIAAPAAPAAVQQSVANDRGGLTVTGTNGNDGVAFGNTGDDIIVGFDGDDALVGFNGNDFLDGGAGNDRVFGSQGDDIVLGGAGDDIVRGDNEAAGNGADIIVGGAGNDLLKGDGNNLVGADTFVFAPGDGNDIIQDFQPGVDKFDVSAFGDVEIEIRQQGSDTLVTVGDVNVTLRGINADDLNADDFNEVSVAGNNNVVVEQQDEVVVVENNDGSGNNAAGGVNAADFGIAAPATPAAVQQTVANAQGGLTVTGTNGNDGVAFGNTGADVVVAFDGDDALVGFNGNDFLDGGAGNDRVFGSQDDDIVLGGAGDDIVRGDNEAAGNGADIIVGGAGNDLLKGDGNNLVGADTFVFAAGDGNDIIQDFQVGVDRLDVNAIDDGIVISLDQEGTNTIVSVADVTITLQNVDADDLSEQDFIGATIEDSEIGTTPTFTTDDSLIG